MASDLQTKPTPKFETFVESQLAKVRRRMRALDVGAAALLLPVVILGYLAIMAVFDLAVGGGEEGWVFGVRLGMFGLFLLVLGYCGYILFSRMMRNINPHYAARQLEQTIPDAKNSVINWLDLKEERLPPAIRSSLGQRAARDLNEADPEQVLDTRPNVMLGTVVGVLFLILLVIFAMSPGQFGSLLARAFAPFRDIALAQRATITLVRPAEGNAVIPHNQGIEIVAQIDGRFPRVNQAGAPALHYRYDQAVDVYRTQPLEEDANGNWTAKVPADLVQTGFWYKLTAGDAATQEYQVEVRSAPHAVKYEITYKYRPYLLVSEETVVFPNQQAVFPEILAHRGTEVSLVVRANQPIRDGKVQLVYVNGKESRAEEMIGESVADDPKAFRCTWMLKQSGHFHVLFKSERREDNTDRSPHQMLAIEDGVPIVALDKPGQDISLPANGTLALEGKARDDFGVKSMTLKVRVLEGGPRDLADKPYRPDKSFKFETGGYPSLLEYKDFVALEKLTTAQGQPLPLETGMVLEYWLEATDNSDYPEVTGNVGRSKAFKVKIEPPQEDQKKQQQQRQQVQKQQKEHEQKQDQKQQQENEQKKQEAADKGKSPDQRGAEDLKNKLDKQAQDLKDKLDNQQKQEEQKNQGEAKGADAEKCECKGNGGEQPGQASAKDQTGQENQKEQQNPPKPKSDDKQQTGSSKKDGPKGDEKNPDNQAAQAKDRGDSASKQPDLKKDEAGEAKNEGADQKPGASAKGGDKEENVNPQNQNANQNQKAGDKGTAKDHPKDKEQSAQSKDQGPKSSEKQQSQAKDNSPDSGDKSPEKKDKGGQAKSGDSQKEAPSPQAKQDKKQPNENAGKKADSKPGSNQQITNEKGSDKGKPPQTATKSPPGADKDGQQRPAQAKGSDEPKSKAQAKSSPQNDKSSDVKQGPRAQAKDQPEKKGLKPQPPGTDKQTPGDNTKDSAVAKDKRGGDKQDGDKQAGEKQADKGQPPTMKDLERLKEQLAKGDPEALKEMEKLAKELDNIKEPNVRKQAEELMQEAAKKMPKDDMPPMTTKDGPETSKGMTDKDGPEKQAPMTAQKDGQPKEKGGDGQGDKQKPKTGNEPSTAGKAEGSGPNAAGPQDNLKGTDPNKDFADRGGDLQLEDLKKRMTPEMRKAAGISDEEWSKFLKDAQAYEQMRQKSRNQPQTKEPDQKRGAASQLQSVTPRQVRNLGGNVNPLDAGLTQPPPELRDAQRRFNQYNTP